MNISYIHILFQNFQHFPFAVLSNGLKDHFEEISVTEVECPDLTAAPYNSAANGLSGSQTIIEIGGPPYLFPLVDRTKVYDLVEISRKILPNANSLYICGAAPGPHPSIQTNCEVIIIIILFCYS